MVMKTNKIQEVKEEEIKQMPKATYRAGQVKATIWEKDQEKNGQTFKVYTTTIVKSYKDKDGKWHDTNSIQKNDIQKAILVLQKAQEYLLMTGEDVNED